MPKPMLRGYDDGDKLPGKGLIVRYSSYQGSRPDPIVILIAVNAALFLIVTLMPELMASLGLQPAAFLKRPWTLVTSMFIHNGLFHLAANMMALYFFGGYLSRLIGNRQFLIIYFGGGILGSVLFLLLGPSLSIAVGASGAIFALGGALAALQPNLKVFIIPIPVPIPLWIAVIGGFFIVSLLPSIAWQAHLGGLVFGLIAGYRLKQRSFFL